MTGGGPDGCQTRPTTSGTTRGADGAATLGRCPAPALDVSGLTVRYGDTLAVDGLDLTIPTGQTVALLGPNGAGKSTVINAVLGLLHPAAGSVSVLGQRPQTPSAPAASARCSSTADCPPRRRSARC